MATLRELVPGYAPNLGALVPGAGTAPQAAGLRAPDVQAIDDAAAVAGMGQLRRSFASGRLGGDANVLRAEQAGLRADGREAEAAALDPRVQAARARAATFAPTEQDVTALDWNPGRIVDWGLGTVGQAAASMLDPVALGAAANVAGTAAGAIPHPLAKVAGGALRYAGMAGGFGLNAQQAKGEFVEDAYSDPALMARTTPQQLNNAANFSGAVSGAADSILTTGVAGRIAGRPTTRALAGMGMPAKVGLDVAGEGLTELGQGEVKRGTLGYLNPERDTSGDANARWNDFAGGLVGAAPISAASQYAAGGFRRLGVKDDTSSDDVSGRAKLPGAAPAKENLTERLVRGAKQHSDDDAAETWNGTLSGLSGSGDIDADTTTRHDALLKELGDRAAKGDATAQQFADTLGAMDKANPTSWYDDAPRDAAYQHLMGDGTDHAKVVEAYQGRKQNRQGAKTSPEAELAASILTTAMPAARGVDSGGWASSSRAAAADIGQTLSDLATRKGKIGASDIDRVLSTAGKLVNALSLDGARSAVARVAMALGAEATPAFQMLQKHLSAADVVQMRRDGRKTRLEAAQQVVSLLPAEARLKLFKAGFDVTTPQGQMSLLDRVQDFGNAKEGRTRSEFASTFGPEVADKMLALVAPGKVEEREGAGEKKTSGGGKTVAQSIGADDTVEAKPTVAGDDADETAGRDLDNALRGIDKAPGSKLYVFNKRHHPVSSTKPGEHPFVVDKKNKTLPTLATADQTDKATGFKTLERMAEQLYTKLGGDPFTAAVTKAQRGAVSKDQYGMDRRRIVRENLKQNDIKNDDPKTAVSAFGIGSYRIRTVSAKEVMDDREVPESSRVKLMTDYLHQDGIADKSLGLIKRMTVLDRRIKAADSAESKTALEEERRTAIAAMAQTVGMKDFDGTTTLGNVADAYFGDRFLVTAEQMAEKDQLRLDLAEVVRMIRRGNDDLDFSDQFGEDQGAIQADMNLIRFESPNAVSKDGIATVRAGDLVAWVFKNRNDYVKKEGDAEVRAGEYRDALMEGVGALAADGYMSELPYMLNADGKKERFGGTKRGFPPSLKLGRMTQADLTKSARQRAATKLAELREANAADALRDPEEREKSAARVERARQMRVARDQDKTEDVKNTDPTELLDEGREAPRLNRTDEDGERLPSDGARYWDAPKATTSQEARLAAANANADAVKNPEVDPFTGETEKPKARRVSGTATEPETTETRRNSEDRTQLDWDMAEAPDAVPTDFADVRNATSVLNSALDKAETLTPTNAAAKGRLLAERLWGQFRDGRAQAIDGLQRLVAATERPVEPTDGGYAGGPHYAVPAALLLTPDRVARLVDTSQGPAKARRLLDGLRARTAAALLNAESVLPLHQRVPLARALLGNEKLTGATMKPVLKALAIQAKPETAKAEPKPKAVAASAVATKTLNVWHGTGENAQFSNLASRPFAANGHAYLSVEHAYQSLKSGAFDQTTFSKYKVAGRKIPGQLGTKTEGGWNLTLMKKLIAASFGQNPAASEALKATGSAVFSHKQDTGVWAKEFPRILSEVRAGLAEPKAVAAPAVATKPVEPAGDLFGPTPNGRRNLKTASVPDLLMARSKAVDHLKHDDQGVEYAAENSTDEQVIARAHFETDNDDKESWAALNAIAAIDREIERRLNAQSTASATTGVYSDAEVAKAKAHFAKVLGPQVNVLASETFPDAGEWNDAEQTARLSTAIGPGVLSVAYHESMHGLWSRLVKNSPSAAKILAKTFSSENEDAAQRLDAEIARRQARIADIEESMKNRPETGPDAEAAIGAKREKINGLSSEIAVMRQQSERLRANDAGSVFARLKAELANEPAALAAITTGPHAVEERVAYGYQFWAAGLLDVDKPATTLFAKMRKMLRKVLGMVRESETALELMTAFHDGKLAEPSAAGRVIDKIMKAQTWNEDVKRKFDKQVQGVFAAVAPSNQVLRKEDLSVTARKLGMLMLTNPGEELAGRFKKGYLNARRTTGNQYTNYLYGAIKSLSPRDMEAAVEELQLQREPTTANLPYAPVRQAVERVQALTQRYWTYATGDAGMKLEFLGKYHYPRVWSLNTLVEGGGKDKFIAMLMQPKYAKTMKSAAGMTNENLANPFTTEQIAEQMYQHLVEKNGVDDKGLAAEQNDLLAPFFASQKERSFKWLDNEDVRPFLEKDLVGAMSRYLHQGVRAAEYVRRFGEGGKDLKEMLAMKGDTWINPETDKKEDRPEHGAIAGEIAASLKEKGVTGKEADEVLARHMEDIKKSVEAHEGSLGRNITPEWRKASSFVLAYQNLRLLPLSLFAAFGDTIGVAARYGEGGGKLAFQAFLQGLRDVYARWKDAASDMPAERQKSVWEGIAEMIGAVDSHMFLEQLGKAYTSEFMTDIARKANRALFMANGLTAWDRSMRVSGTKAAVLFLQHHASLPDKQHSKRWLAELGLAPENIPLDAEGKLITDRHVLAATKGIPLEQATAEMERVHTALVRWVEGAVLTPNAGQRPTWASDPHWAVLFHLKQFTYSFQDTILRRAFNEASHGNMNPIGALAAAVPTMVAADMVKGLVVGGGSFPDYMKAWDTGDWLVHGMQRAGHLGVAQFGIDALNDPTSLFGPAVDQVTDFVWNPTEVGKNVLNAIPGARMVGDLKDLVRPTV